MLGISSVKVGSAVTAGQTILNTISTDDQFGVEFYIDQKEISRFTSLINFQKPGDTTFTLKFGTDIYPGKGRLVLVDRAADPQTGTIRTRAVFPNPDGFLRAGMSGTFRILNNANEHSILIPFKAVTEQLGEYFVYVAGDSGKVSQRKIILGKAIGNDIIFKMASPSEKRLSLKEFKI